MGSYNTTYDPWVSGERIIPERLNAFRRGIRNHVLTGFVVQVGSGLNLEVGEAGVNAAYINGYEVYSATALDITLDGNMIYDIYLVFTYTEDSVSGSVSTITPSLEAILTTQTPEAENYLKIAQVTTGATQITDIEPYWRAYFQLPQAMFAAERMPIYGWVIPDTNPAEIVKIASSGTRPFEFYEARFSNGASVTQLFRPWEVPFGYATTQPEGFPRLRIFWKCNSTSTSLAARMEVAMAAYTPAVDSGSYNAKGLGSWDGVAVSPLGTTARRLNYAFIEFTDVDSLVAEDMVNLGLRRDPTHSDDNLTSVDVEVVGTAIEYQIGD